MTRIWDDVIPPEEQDLYRRGGMGGRIGFGSWPALLVVDMTYGFVDSAYPLGHSPTGWPAASAIRDVRGAARAAGTAVIYTAARQGDTPMERGRWKGGGAAASSSPRNASPIAALPATRWHCSIST